MPADTFEQSAKLYGLPRKLVAQGALPTHPKCNQHELLREMFAPRRDQDRYYLDRFA